MAKRAALAGRRDMGAQMSARPGLNRLIKTIEQSAVVDLTWSVTGDVITTPTSMVRNSGNGWGAASAHSNQGLTGECYLRFVAPTIFTNRMIGLNTDPAKDANYASIDHAFYVIGGGGVQTWESGAPVGSSASHVAGTVLDIKYYGTTLEYWVGGVLLRSTTIPAGQTFYIDSALNDIASDFVSIIFSSVPIV